MGLKKDKQEDGKIVETYVMQIGNTRITGLINDKYIKGKTREECLAIVNASGKFKFIHINGKNVC